MVVVVVNPHDQLLSFLLPDIPVKLTQLVIKTQVALNQFYQGNQSSTRTK